MGGLRRAFYVQVALNVVCLLAVAALTGYVLYLNRQTTGSLCKFRGDLQQRVDSTQKYLDEHPGPEPFPNVPRVTIQQQLDNQRRTVRSLSNLNC